MTLSQLVALLPFKFPKWISLLQATNSGVMNRCVYIHIYTRMHIRTYTHIHTHTRTHTHTHTHTHTQTHIHTHTKYD